MKLYKFTVIFTNHTVQNVIASGKETAIILAQAKQIEAGLDYNVEAVKKEGFIV